MWRSRKEVKRSIASLPAKCRQLAKVLPSSDGHVVTDLDREFEGIEVIAWRRHIVLPNNTWRSTWDWILILLVIYSALTVPLEISFKYDAPLGILVIDWFVDVFFILDIFLNFRTAFYNYDGTFEIEPSIIRRRYCTTWFSVDLIASIPIERFAGSGSETSAIALAKMPRLLRLSRLLKKLDKFTSARFMRVVSVLIFFLMFTHFVGCFWWLIGVAQDEKGWQFQAEVVPLLLQDVTWEDEARLQTQPLHTAEPGTPGWLPDYYNHSALLDMYETDVGVGKLYITSLYWALTMVMKSPWLPPQSTGEQVFASSIIIFGAIVFAAFLGHVTTMIQSYEKSNALYRDQMTNMHNFFEARSIERETQKSILTYTDAYFKARVEGIPERVIMDSLPAHFRHPVLMELYHPLLASATFLQDCSYSGCGDFLQRLDPEVCLKGDCLLRAGTTSETMYILMSGELQVSYPPEGSQVRRITTLLGSSRLYSKQESEHKQSTRVPQGRVERRGSLVGWQAPFGPASTFRYTARAYRFSQLFSITRTALREVVETHPIDAVVFQKAVEHSNKLLQPSKSMRSCTSSTDLKRDPGAAEDSSLKRVSDAGLQTMVQTTDEEQLAVAARAGFLPACHVKQAASQSLPSRPRAASSTVDEIIDGELLSTSPRAAQTGANASERVSAAWMAQREQAEAALRADIQAVRDEVRSGFAEVAHALERLRTLHSAAAPSS